MKKLWHIWVAFAVCLAIGVVGMAWLTVRAIDLDRAEAVARRAAEQAQQRNELQERIALALWRMDWMLSPIITQEATRPSYAYRPFLESPTSKMGGKQPVQISPLLKNPPDFVVLNFDVSAKDGWTSPQSPNDTEVPQAVAAGVSPDYIRNNRGKLSTLGKDISFDSLLTLLPRTLLPAFDAQTDQPQLQQQEDRPVANDYMQQSYWPDQTENQQQSLQQQAELPPPQLAQPPGIAQAPSGGQQGGYLPGPQAQQPLRQSRAQREWEQRNSNMQNAARSQRAQIIAANSMYLPELAVDREGVSRPVWVGDKLIVARRVVNGGEVRIQGSWLDWPKIQQRLKDEIVDLFPDTELRPVTGDEPDAPRHLLATLPVQMVVPAATAPPIGQSLGSANLSAIRISLVIAWCCLLLGSLAVAMMLRGVLALSERRASFVSAVTHELRSPLTTFRMYAEMLAEGMVRDEQQRMRYLATLRQEADRLSHLVDNVLQYARLERGRSARRRVEIPLRELMQQSTERLPQRARQADMELHETLAPQDAKTVVKTDPAAVEQILFNLIDNSCKYASQATDRRIHIHWSVGHRVAQVRVTDHGPGIQGAQAAKLFVPFSKSDQEAAQSAPGIGLGLALCRRLAREIGGQLHYESKNGEGAAFLLELPLAG